MTPIIFGVCFGSSFSQLARDSLS